MKKSKVKFFREYCQTVVEIIETQQSFILPKFFYYLSITILFPQIAGYILSTWEIKPITEWKIYFFTKINEYSPGTFLLFTTGNDSLTIFVFFLMEFAMFFYYGYIAFLTLGKIYKPLLIAQYRSLIKIINQFLNFFLTFYWWIFYTPFIEINSGVFTVGGNSFLVIYRDDLDFSQKPLWQLILGPINLFLTVVTGIIIIYLFRNYQFKEQNLLKRRFHFISVIILISRWLETFLYYLNIPVILVFKHFVGNFISLMIMIDLVLNLPFQDVEITYYYIYALSYFTVQMACTSIWMFTDALPQYNFFEANFILFPLLGSILVKIYEYRIFNCYILIDDEQKGFSNHHLDQALENYIILFEESKKTAENRIKLIIFMKFHMNSCKNVRCTCRRFMVTTQPDQPIDKQQIKMQVTYRSLIQFCEDQFKKATVQKIVLEDQELFEHYQLKYISFLAQYNQNPVLSYFELKRQLKLRNKNISFFFSLISTVYSKVLEEQISSKCQLELEKSKSSSSQAEVQYNIEVVQNMQNTFEEIQNDIQEAIKIKIELFEDSLEKLNTMSDIRKIMIKTAKNLLKINDNIQEKLNLIRSKFTQNQLESQCIYLKILQIELNELRKKDQVKPQFQINNFNLLQGKVIHFLVGLCSEQSEILNQKSQKVANFFEYDESDWYIIKNYKNLLVPIVAKAHDRLICHFLSKGYDVMLIQSRQTYLVDKFKFLIPVTFDIKNRFGFYTDLVYQISFLRRPSSEEYIMIDEYGQIQGMTKQLFLKLFFPNYSDITSENQEETLKLYNFIKQLYIYDLSPNFLVGLLDCSNALEEILTKYEHIQNYQLLYNKTCKFKIPKNTILSLTNFDKIIQRQRNIKRNAERFVNGLKKNKSKQQKASKSRCNLTEKQDMSNLKDCLRKINKAYYNKVQLIQNVVCKFNLKITFQNIQNTNVNLTSIKGWDKLRLNDTENRMFYFLLEILDSQVADDRKQKSSVMKISEKQKPDPQNQPDPHNFFRQELSFNDLQLSDKQNLSTIKMDEPSEIASEIINEDLMILNDLKSDESIKLNQVIEEKQFNEISNEQIQNIIDVENQIKFNEVAPRKKMLQPLIFMKNQIIFEENPQIDYNNDIIISPRGQTKRELIQDQNNSQIQQSVCEQVQEVPQIISPQNFLQSQLIQQHFFVQDKNNNPDEQSEKILVDEKSIEQTQTNSVHSMTSNILIKSLQTGNRQFLKYKYLILTSQLLYLIVLVSGFTTLILYSNAENTKLTSLNDELVISFLFSTFLVQGLQGSIDRAIIQQDFFVTNNFTSIYQQIDQFQITDTYEGLLSEFVNNQQNTLKLGSIATSFKDQQFAMGVFNLGSIEIENLSFYTYISLIIENIHLLNNPNTLTIQQEQDLINSYLFNYPEISQILSEIRTIQLNQLTNTLNYLQNQIIIIICLIGIAFGFIFFFSLIVVKKLNWFEERVLSIHQKLFLDNQEVFNKYKKQLANVKQIEISDNFYLTSKTLNTTFIKHSQNEKTATNTKKKSKKNAKKPKKNKRIEINGSVSILQKLPVLFTLTISNILFFFSILFITNTYSSQQKQLFNLYVNTSQSISVFNQLILDTNMLVYRTFQNSYNYYNNETYWINNFNKDFQQSQSYMTLLISLKNSLNNENFQNILSGNLCDDMIKNNMSTIYSDACQNFSPNYQDGLIQILQNTMKMLANYQTLLTQQYGTLTQQQKMDIIQFCSSQDYQSMIKYYFIVVSMNSQNFIMGLKDYVSNQLSQQLIFIIDYNYAIGIVMFALQVMLFQYIKKKLFNDLKELQFSLSFPPSELMNEQTIYFMLKSLIS